MSRQAVIVLGMHRSGTSMLANVFNKLGYEFGGQLLEPQEDNPDGFWENHSVVSFHDEILRECGSNWFDPVTQCVVGEGLRQGFKSRLKEILTTEFADGGDICIKDPRICRFIDLWVETLDECGFDARFLLVVRSPDQVARSIERRNGYDSSSIMMSWLVHNLNMLRYTPDAKREVIRFDDLVAGPLEVMLSALRSLGVDVDDALLAKAVDHIDTGRISHKARDAVNEDTKADVFQRLAFDLYHAMATGSASDWKVVESVEADLSRSRSAAMPWITACRQVSDDQFEWLVSQVLSAHETLLGDRVAAPSREDAGIEAYAVSLLDSLVENTIDKVVGIQRELEHSCADVQSLRNKYDGLDQQYQAFRSKHDQFLQAPIKAAFRQHAKRMKDKLSK